MKRAGIPVEEDAPGSPSDSNAMDDVRHLPDDAQGTNGDHNSIPIKTQDGDIRSPPNMNTYEERFLAKSSGGRFISDHSGKTRYLENNLWVTLNDELREPEQMVQDQVKDQVPSDEENAPDADAAYLLFGGHPSDRELRRQYPPPEVADHLWQTYIRNVNPITKILHIPNFQSILDLAKRELTKVSKSQLALLYSVFHFAIVSVDLETFERTFTQPRDFLLTRFRALTQQALVNASFLRSSDLATLQAFTNYLLSTRLFYDAQTVWILSGVAFRIARRLGLHHDGEEHGLPPFEVEMRRRLWLQLVILDHTSAELAGTTPTFMAMASEYWDTKRPLNINDLDLDPSATEYPPERVGATEMIFCLLRFEFGDFFRKHRRAQQALAKSPATLSK